MTKNVGDVDRVIRIIIGLAVFSMLFFVEGNLRYLGFIGLIPLITGLIGFCPIYAIFGASTNKGK